MIIYHTSKFLFAWNNYYYWIKKKTTQTFISKNFHFQLVESLPIVDSTNGFNWRYDQMRNMTPDWKLYDILEKFHTSKFYHYSNRIWCSQASSTLLYILFMHKLTSNFIHLYRAIWMIILNIHLLYLNHS